MITMVKIHTPSHPNATTENLRTEKYPLLSPKSGIKILLLLKRTTQNLNINIQKSVIAKAYVGSRAIQQTIDKTTRPSQDEVKKQSKKEKEEEKRRRQDKTPGEQVCASHPYLPPSSSSSSSTSPPPSPSPSSNASKSARTATSPAP